MSKRCRDDDEFVNVLRQKPKDDPSIKHATNSEEAYASTEKYFTETDRSLRIRRFRNQPD
ncbi:hypothetical protein DFQ29_003131 [Apophysomyces sp. BC1021]|nr:hypothetical protein DFQ29_003131 [Apophysomyces sp. BC1021]